MKMQTSSSANLMSASSHTQRYSIIKIKQRCKGEKFLRSQVTKRNVPKPMSAKAFSLRYVVERILSSASPCREGVGACLHIWVHRALSEQLEHCSRVSRQCSEGVSWHLYRHIFLHIIHASNQGLNKEPAWASSPAYFRKWVFRLTLSWCF